MNLLIKLSHQTIYYQLISEVLVCICLLHFSFLFPLSWLLLLKIKILPNTVVPWHNASSSFELEIILVTKAVIWILSGLAPCVQDLAISICFILHLMTIVIKHSGKVLRRPSRLSQTVVSEVSLIRRLPLGISLELVPLLIKKLEVLPLVVAKVRWLLLD